MDPSKSLDHYATRRDLLRGFLDEYLLLTKEHPELVQRLSFDGFVQFSFAYFRISEQTTHAVHLADEIVEMREATPD